MEQGPRSVEAAIGGSQEGPELGQILTPPHDVDRLEDVYEARHQRVAPPVRLHPQPQPVGLRHAIRRQERDHFGTWLGMAHPRISGRPRRQPARTPKKPHLREAPADRLHGGVVPGGHDHHLERLAEILFPQPVQAPLDGLLGLPRGDDNRCHGRDRGPKHCELLPATTSGSADGTGDRVGRSIP